MTREEVQSMIESALRDAVMLGMKIALQSDSGKILSAINGGPMVDEMPFQLVAKSEVHAHETWVIVKGQG